MFKSFVRHIGMTIDNIQPNEAKHLARNDATDNSGYTRTFHSGHLKRYHPHVCALDFVYQSIFLWTYVPYTCCLVPAKKWKS